MHKIEIFLNVYHKTNKGCFSKRFRNCRNHQMTQNYIFGLRFEKVS